MIDPERLRSFEERLEPSRFRESPGGARLLGQGEISAVFALADQPGIALVNMS